MVVSYCQKERKKAQKKARKKMKQDRREDGQNSSSDSDKPKEPIVVYPDDRSLAAGLFGSNDN